MTNILFVHINDSWYLETVLNVAKSYNPDANIILLGDDKNRKDSMDQTDKNKWTKEFMEKRDKSKVLWAPYASFGYEEFPKEYLDLITNYEHIGTDVGKRVAWKHQMGFSRWYLIYELINKFGNMWYFDSDTLICRKLSEIQDRYAGLQAWNINRISGCASYFNSSEILKELCLMIYKRRKDKVYIDNMKKNLEDLKNRGIHYNFCDMTIIAEWSKTYAVGDLAVIKEHSVFDANINVCNADQWKVCPYSFEMVECVNRPIKKVYFIRDNKVGKTYPYFKNLNSDMTDKRKESEESTSYDLIRANTLNMSWFDHRKNEFYKIIDGLNN